MAEPSQLDESCAPEIFKKAWDSNPDTKALPFPKDNPPFALTAVDWQQLTLPDAAFSPHTWDELCDLISHGQLDQLKRQPRSLKAYLAWTAHIKQKYGSSTTYLLQQRLFWTPLPTPDGALAFPIHNPTPFADERDYKVLCNDWPYGLEAGIHHIVVWLKVRLPVDGEGALTEQGRRLVEEFVEEKFRKRVREERKGSRVVWFKNTTALQSVRSLEHVHVLVRDVDEGLLEQWRT